MSSPPTPRVTVCVTAYNQADYVAEAIDSVLAQRGCDPEVFVLDDASTDETTSIIAQYKDQLGMIENERNLGLCPNWNRALSLGTAPYIAILHGDDRYAPDMLRRSCELLDNHPAVGYVYTAHHVINDRGEPLDLTQPFPEDHVWPGLREFAHHIRWNYVQCPTVVVRRACYERLGGFDPRFFYALDWEMWLRIETHGYQIGYISEPLACWRIHPASETQNLRRRGEPLVQDDIAVINCVFEKLWPASPPLEQLKRTAFHELTKRCALSAYSQARRGEWRAARTSLLDAWAAYQAGSDVGIIWFLLKKAIRKLSAMSNPSDCRRLATDT